MRQTVKPKRLPTKFSDVAPYFLTLALIARENAEDTYSMATQEALKPGTVFAISTTARDFARTFKLSSSPLLDRTIEDLRRVSAVAKLNPQYWHSTALRLSCSSHTGKDY